ncbi:hypothetical protein FOCC_FOCC010998 [Frankliniella occidentalis]|nr:hypothetical protein FOCC_FOCC010998 [Frankliniella occidentalis]
MITATSLKKSDIQEEQSVLLKKKTFGLHREFLNENVAGDTVAIEDGFDDLVIYDTVADICNDRIPVLKLLFDLVAPHIKKNYKKASLSKFLEFSWVLVRLRLGLLEEDLADRLNVTQSCVSKIFNLWVPVMAECSKHFIVWPERETLQKTMPECFRKSFGTSVVVVIGCFEVTAPTPSGLLAKAQTYSHYKKNTTAKFLFGVAPQCTVSYISPAWGTEHPTSSSLSILKHSWINFSQVTLSLLTVVLILAGLLVKSWHVSLHIH